MPVISRIKRQWNANFVKSVAFFVLPFAVTGITTSAAFYPQKALAYVKGNEQVADIAKSITVRIEGASTPASGVLVHREGNRYTVLTAWHVVSAQNPGEELAIYTSDGIQHQLDRGSIERVGNVDLAVLTFTSSSRYEIASKNTAAPRTGARIYLYGYPAATTSVPMRISRGSSGEIVGSTSNQSLNGYELMYATQMPSMTGMSGGPVLDSNGNLIGIHARSETNQTQTVEEGVAIRTGMSQGVPITYFSRSIAAVETVETGLADSKSTSLPQLPAPPRISADLFAAAAPKPSGYKIWVKARQAITLKQLARQSVLDEALLSELNDVKANHVFGRSEWMVLPSGSINQIKLISAVDTSDLRRTPPLAPPPEPSDTARIQRGDNTLAKVAERYNLSIQKLLKLNPGLRGAQLVIGTPIRVAQANAVRSRMVLGLKPVGSGGLSWPDQPDFGDGENLNDRATVTTESLKMSNSLFKRYQKLASLKPQVTESMAAVVENDIEMSSCTSRFGHTGCSARIYAKLICRTIGASLASSEGFKMAKSFDAAGVNFRGITSDEIETAAIRYYMPIICPTRSDMARELFEK